MRYTRSEKQLIMARARAKLRQLKKQSPAPAIRKDRPIGLIYKTNRDALVRR
jgi:hypothetical protein